VKPMGMKAKIGTSRPRSRSTHTSAAPTRTGAAQHAREPFRYGGEEGGRAS